MRPKHQFTVHAVIALANGIVFLVIPVQYLAFFGITLTGPALIFIGRLFAAALLAYGFVCLFARNAGPSDARRAILLGFCISIAVGFILTLVAQLQGLMNVMGWSLVALYLVMSTGYGYFYLQEPQKIRDEGGDARLLEMTQ